MHSAQKHMKHDEYRPRPEELVRIETCEQVDVGDTVYEEIRYGHGPQHVKYNAYRVTDVVRKGCTLTPITNPGRKGHAGTEITRAFGNLYLRRPVIVAEVPTRINQPFRGLNVVNTNNDEFKPVPPLELTSKPAPSTSDPFTAWVEMGHDLLKDIAHERAQLEAAQTQVVAELDKLDTMHRVRIEQLEAELAVAKQDHVRDRALAAGRQDALNRKLGALQERCASVERILKGAAE